MLNLPCNPTVELEQVLLLEGLVGHHAGPALDQTELHAVLGKDSQRGREHAVLGGDDGQGLVVARGQRLGVPAEHQKARYIVLAVLHVGLHNVELPQRPSHGRANRSGKWLWERVRVRGSE